MESADMDTVETREKLLDAALAHVPFDGWTEATFRAAAMDIGIAPDLARVICPRGALDLAVVYHKRGDEAMVARLRTADLADMRFRDRIAAAVRYRLEEADPEAVRRGAALFALPQNGPVGASLVWGTADAIWTALGDTSTDVNWYTKRATLSGVYSTTALFWLGDESPGKTATWEFLDRRIDNVMQFEKLKSTVKDSPVLSRVFAGPIWLAGQIKAPSRVPNDMPGFMRPRG